MIDPGITALLCTLSLAVGAIVGGVWMRGWYSRAVLIGLHHRRRLRR